MRFRDRTVLVTGASRGLGRAIAEAFGAEGAFVFVGCRARADLAAQVVESVRAAGGDGAALPLDVRDRASVDRAIAEALALRPALDVVVNNAAVLRDGFLATAAPEDFDESLATNLAGPWNVARAAVRPMIARGRGVIVNVGSLAGLRANPGQGAYSASKAGLDGLTRTLGAELAPRGIRVNAVVPGYLDTGMAARMDRRALEAARESIPLRRVGTAAEVARVVLFLASDDASYLVGQSLVVDGGLSL